MPDAIPHEALARAVRAAFGADARIAAEERLFGDASSRRYVRLRLAGGDAPPAAVARLLGADRVPLRVAGARHPDPSCLAFRRRFDEPLARWELEHFVEHGIETRHGRPLPADERARLLAALSPVAAPFAQGTPVLVHRDFMAWNL